MMTIISMNVFTSAILLWDKWSFSSLLHTLAESKLIWWNQNMKELVPLHCDGIIGDPYPWFLASQTKQNFVCFVFDQGMITLHFLCFIFFSVAVSSLCSIQSINKLQVQSIILFLSIGNYTCQLKNIHNIIEKKEVKKNKQTRDYNSKWNKYKLNHHWNSCYSPYK